MKIKDGTLSFCFIDTETGGTEPETSCIIEIGAMRVELDVNNKTLKSTHVVDTKVKPTVPVDPGAANINGYNAKDWEDAKSIEEALNHMFPLIQGSVIAGWNADFDLRFIKKAWGSFNWQWPRGTPYKTFEVSSLCIDLILSQEINDLHLSTVGSYYGFIPDGQNPHRGILDILLTIKIFEHHMRLKGAVTSSEINYSELDKWSSSVTSVTE